MRMQLIGNRYRVKSLIGEGGMASVYAAIDEKLDRRIAIKILHSHLARNQDIRKRFHQEARSISGIDHPNIIKIYDFSGVDSEQLWIVTEILYGVDLAEYVQRFPKNRLHPLVASLITREICKALSEAHRHGIVHRDIKPENIMVLDSGRIKLMDFGIAKVAQNPSATQTGTFMGSPSYMSPEQIRGIKIDARTDIYSLSVLFYEIVAGVLPFVGNTTPDVINKIIVGKFSPPIAINPMLPKVLDQIIIRGLKGNRDERYAEINHLASDLDQFLKSCGMEESHIELERFFRNPKDFEKKLADFDRNNQVQPKMLKITDANAGESKTDAQRSKHKTRMNLPVEQYTPSTPSKARQSQANKTVSLQNPAAENSGSSSLKNTYPSQPRSRPSARVYSGSQQRARQRQTQVTRRSSRSTSSSNSSNFFWSSILVVSFIAAAFLGVVLYFDSSKDGSGLTNLRKELSRTKQSPQRRLPTSQQPNQTSSSTARRTDGSEGLGSTNQLAQTSKSASDDNRSRVRSTEPTIRLEGPATSTKDERSLTSGTVVRNPSASSPQQPATRRTGIVTRSKPEGAEPAPMEQQTPATSTGVVSVPEPSPPVAALKPNPGTIHIRSFPAAEIYIDEQSMGVTSDRRLQQRGISLAPGRYRLSLRRSGFESADEVVEVKDSEVLKLNYVLSRKQVFIPLTLQSNRIPALVYIDELKADGRKNQITLTDNTYTLQLEPGSYRIEVVYSGQRIERVIEIKNNDDPMTFTANFD